MEKMINCARAACALGFVLLASACAPSAYVVDAPKPSGVEYAIKTDADPKTYVLVDQRAESAQVFNTGTLNATLKYEGEPLAPPQFLATHVERELESRGLPVEIKPGESGESELVMHDFRMQNHRSNGFAPYVTFTYGSMDIREGDESQRIGAFVKRGKVPVWSFAEVVDPTMNEPISIVVKELASKIANEVYDYQAPDQVVDDLVARIRKENGGATYLDVYQLGFTNNPRAIEPLVELVDAEDEYIRLAAISSLGNMQAVGHYDLLKSIYESGDGLWQDRAMALKAIGDLGTPEARDYLRQEQARWMAQDPPTKESAWTSQVISLYLE